MDATQKEIAEKIRKLNERREKLMQLLSTETTKADPHGDILVSKMSFHLGRILNSFVLIVSPGLHISTTRY